MSVFVKVQRAIAGVGGLRRAIRLTVSNPGRTLASALRILSTGYSSANESMRTLREFEQELLHSGFLPQLSRSLNSAFCAIESADSTAEPGTMRAPHLAAIYALVRARKPSFVVETGVCNGFSTAVILKALEMNDNGALHSIDLPDIVGLPRPEGMWAGKGGAAIPPDKSPGWLIPDEYRHRWTLHIGRSQDLLPELLEKGGLDMFVSDGEHSYSAQRFEFQEAWQRLSGGGVLILTDINQSEAFTESISSVFGGATIRYIDHSAAVIYK